MHDNHDVCLQWDKVIQKTQAAGQQRKAAALAVEGAKMAADRAEGAENSAKEYSFARERV